jgi:hypothetical protein
LAYKEFTYEWCFEKLISVFDKKKRSGKVERELSLGVFLSAASVMEMGAAASELELAGVLVDQGRAGFG